MTRRTRTGHTLAVFAVSLLVLVMSPVVLLAGEFVNRRYRRRWRARGWAAMRRARLRDGASPVTCGSGPHRASPAVRLVLTNPLWIALTAPARWVLDHLRPRLGGRNGNGGNGGPGAGVREPRRPLPDPPAGAIALPDPYQPG